MVSWILCLLTLVSITLGPFAISESAQMTFEVEPDGAVLLGDHQYKSLSEYYTSNEFRLNGRRCGTKPLAAALAESAEAPLAAPQDCTFAQTVIKDEYWPGKVYVIPIVFHVIQKVDGTGNIPDSNIYNQVNTLNEDFRALAGTLGEAGFDSHIAFELAGITRTVNDDWFGDGDGMESQYKTALGWDQQRYLNIYVNLASGYLGYAYFPQGSAGSIYDGVVVFYNACGGRNEGSEPYDQGRTLTHEIGHYLGLFHTFEEGCLTGYSRGDRIVDTNPESEEHFGCAQTDSCDTPDPIHNYMNYTDDLCMQEFTAEQANRAFCGLLNYRPDLYHISAGAREKPIFVKKITMRLKSPTQGTSFARGSVIVQDENGLRVPGVTISVRWSGVVDGTDFKKTDSLGRAIFSSPETTQNGTFTLEVTSVYRGNKRYKPSLNVVTTGSITN